MLLSGRGYNHLIPSLPDTDDYCLLKGRRWRGSGVSGWTGSKTSCRPHPHYRRSCKRRQRKENATYWWFFANSYEQFSCIWKLYPLLVYHPEHWISSYMIYLQRSLISYKLVWKTKVIIFYILSSKLLRKLTHYFYMFLIGIFKLLYNKGSVLHTWENIRSHRMASNFSGHELFCPIYKNIKLSRRIINIWTRH